MVYFVSIRKRKSVASSGNFLQCALLRVIKVLLWTTWFAAADYNPVLLFITERGFSSCNFRFVAETLHFPNGRLQLTCVAKIEDLWSDRTTQVAYGAGEVGQPNQLLISNLAGN